MNILSCFRSFMFFTFPVRSMIHFKFIFVFDVKYGSQLIPPSHADVQSARYQLLRDLPAPLVCSAVPVPGGSVLSAAFAFPAPTPRSGSLGARTSTASSAPAPLWTLSKGAGVLERLPCVPTSPSVGVSSTAPPRLGAGLRRGPLTRRGDDHSVCREKNALFSRKALSETHQPRQYKRNK